LETATGHGRNAMPRLFSTAPRLRVFEILNLNLKMWGETSGRAVANLFVILSILYIHVKCLALLFPDI